MTKPIHCDILEPTEFNLRCCADFLRSGEVLGVPTETVYGLAGNALCDTTVRKIFAVKGRPFIDPLIVHFSSIDEAAVHVDFNDRARALAEQFWPGALTLVLPKKSSIPDIVTAGLPSVAIRVPGHRIFRSLLDQVDFPLAAPSANPFGYVSPTRAIHVKATLGQRIPAVLDDGPCKYGVESTIIDLRNPNLPAILRPGPISARALGVKINVGSDNASEENAQVAPGMLTQHYSPKAKIILFPYSSSAGVVMPGGAIVYNKKPPEEALQAHTYWLSENGDLEEIAHNLFMVIQKLDQAGYTQLLIERTQETDIGIAVNDRLRRSAMQPK